MTVPEKFVGMYMHTIRHVMFQEPKKLVRYRDNKIVSLKGERFTEVKKEEEDDMKKTYVSIKAARQYRFH
jgi:hypothetical protein